MNRHYTAQDVMQILSIGRTSAFEIIKELNQELHDMGYKTCPGRVSSKYFEYRYDFTEENHHASV